MKSRRSFVLGRRSLALALALALGSPAARADYLLASGDVLEITVFRVPELTRQAAVDVEGQIAFPPLGLIDVAGASLEEVSETIRNQLAESEILSDAQVTVALAAARPVFVGGDVAAPGAFPYQAGLSVRRAIALAGGLGTARTLGAEELATLRSEYEVLTADLFRDEARLARARAELDGRDELATAPSVAPDGRRAEIFDLERRRLQANIAEAEQEKAHLARSLALVVERIDTLGGQVESQQRQIEDQTAEVERYRQLLEQGLAPQTRVVQESRILESLQERAADTASETAQVQQQREEFAYELDRFDERRRTLLESEAQEALLGIETSTARLRGVAERMAQLGLADVEQLRITVYRTEEGEETALEVSEGMILQPGDMVEIELDLPPVGLGSASLLSPTDQSIASSDDDAGTSPTP